MTGGAIKNERELTSNAVGSYFISEHAKTT
jgi:hypothetical protein